MSRFTLFLCAALLVVGTWLFADARGHSRGLAEGKLQVQAAHDSTAVGQLNALIGAQTQLTTEAQKASSQLRQAAAKRQEADQLFLKGFDDALLKTTASRSGCVFEPGVMQQLAAARQRAATAAAGGTGGAAAAVRPASGPTGGQR